MEQKLRSGILILVGIIALFLSFKCYTIDDLGYESSSMYGGDAYTGIQNAAAKTSQNVKELASIVQFGFGSVLLVMGLTILGFGLTMPMGTNKEVAENAPVDEKPAEDATKETPVEEVNTQD